MEWKERRGGVMIGGRYGSKRENGETLGKQSI